MSRSEKVCFYLWLGNYLDNFLLIFIGKETKVYKSQKNRKWSQKQPFYDRVEISTVGIISRLKTSMNVTNAQDLCLDDA